MTLIDKQGNLLKEDRWCAHETIETIKEDYAYIPIDLWRALDDKQREALLDRTPHLGLELAGEKPWTENADILKGTSLLVVSMGGFRDGRPYSLIYRLRQQLKYKGEVRIIGDFLIDQIYFFTRCGATSFRIRAEDIEDVKKLLTPFTYAYQDASDHPTIVTAHRRQERN